MPHEADLEAVAERLETVIRDGSPERSKALLRLLIKELKVNGRAEILPTYRVVTLEVCATPSSVGRTVHWTNREETRVSGPPLAV